MTLKSSSAGRTFSNVNDVQFNFTHTDRAPIPVAAAVFVDGRLMFYGRLYRAPVQTRSQNNVPQVRVGPSALKLTF